jgi:peptide/nickel transport system substrate-binding protein
VTLQGYPSGRFFTNFAGVPNYVHQHDLGLVTSGWAPDWADGFGFLYYLTAGSAIRPAANYNIDLQRSSEPAPHRAALARRGHIPGRARARQATRRSLVIGGS